MKNMNEVQKSHSAINIIIIVLLIATLGVVYYLGFVKDSSNETTTTESSNSMTKEEATSIVNDVYSNAYNVIDEGNGLQAEDTVTISVGEEDSVGGVISTKAYKLDFSKIESYFTDRAINYIKTYYTDTPNGHDGSYYIFATENQYSTDHYEFLNTIFGITDQSKRTFEVKIYDDNYIVAVSSKSSSSELDEYIVLKKVDNTWKIDMFETL